MNNRKILKAEILITRKCNLKCSYCKMVQYREECNSYDWNLGLIQLKKLGCEFAPIYGAEPLMVFSKLKNFLTSAIDLDIKTSVITNGILLTEDKIKQLKLAGMDSITLSLDSLYEILNDNSVSKRNKRVEFILEKLKKLYIRDIEISVTVHRENFKQLPEIIRYFTARGIWVSFDTIHWDRGQPGTKVSIKSEIEHLIFQPVDYLEVRDVMFKVLEMIKSANYLIHTSKEVVEFWCEKNHFINLDWHCKYPGWITIDCNGDVLICDDFSLDKNHIKVWEIYDRWDEFLAIFSADSKLCPGCFWSTHIMSESMIKNKRSGDYFSHQISQKELLLNEEQNVHHFRRRLI